MLVLLASTVFYVSETSRAADVPSVAAGPYNTGSTWSDGLAPSAGKDYRILHLVHSTGSADEVLAGDSLTVRPGGTLRREQTSTARRSLTTPPLTLAGGKLQFSANNQYRREFDFESPVVVASNSIIIIGRTKNGRKDVYLNGGLSGTADIEFICNAGGSAEVLSSLHITTPTNTFSGNWDIYATDSGTAVLKGAASRSLGTGTVTLGLRGTLMITAESGIDSLTSIAITDSSARLDLNNLSWHNKKAILSMSTGTFDLGDKASVIGEFNINGTKLSQRTYTATDLTNLGYGGTFAGSGTIEIVRSGTVLLIE